MSEATDQLRRSLHHRNIDESPPHPGPRKSTIELMINFLDQLEKRLEDLEQRLDA
jgi:hypothetical protein